MPAPPRQRQERRLPQPRGADVSIFTDFEPMIDVHADEAAFTSAESLDRIQAVARLGTVGSVQKARAGDDSMTILPFCSE